MLSFIFISFVLPCLVLSCAVRVSFHSHMVLMYDVPVWFSACPLIHVYKTSSQASNVPVVAARNGRRWCMRTIIQVKFIKLNFDAIDIHGLMVFHMMTLAPLTWASEINCYFNGQVIGSRRQISWARTISTQNLCRGSSLFMRCVSLTLNGANCSMVMRVSTLGNFG